MPENAKIYAMNFNNSAVVGFPRQQLFQGSKNHKIRRKNHKKGRKNHKKRE